MSTESKWLTGITAPVGTILGPDARNQYFTVAELDIEGTRVLVRRAQMVDIHRGDTYGRFGVARSVAEHEFYLMGRERTHNAQVEAAKPTPITLPRKLRRKLKKL